MGWTLDKEPEFVASVRIDNRSLAVAVQNRRFRAARASTRYAGYVCNRIHPTRRDTACFDPVNRL
jgi:hypothetical protein